MTKKDIVLKVAADTGLKQLDVKRVVQKSLEAVVESLAKGETVELRNFGIFKVKSRKGRTGRNPRTGEKVPVPPKRVVTFKPGLLMKRDIH
ncbi:MAG: integration host factor subunit beta [Candidatus Omnitrophica bacterium]|nr:integration host factor subunit beta [Candidatus Omnitrophota bacterium]